MNRIILTKTIVLTEFVFHLKNLSAVCTDDTHKNGRLFRGGVAYIYIYIYRISDMRCYKLLLFDCCRQVGDMRGRSTSVPAKYYHSHIITLFLSLLMSTSCQQDCRAGFHSSRSTECPAHRGSLQRLHLDH